MLAIMFILIFAFNSIMKYVLKVERKKLFSYNHINEKHKKIDWTLRIGFIVSILVLYFIYIAINAIERDWYWYFQPAFLSFVYLFVAEIVRAYMEKKYAENRRDYIFTLSQLGFIAILLVVMFNTDFFGIFTPVDDYRYLRI